MGLLRLLGRTVLTLIIIGLIIIVGLPDADLLSGLSETGR